MRATNCSYLKVVNIVIIFGLIKVKKNKPALRLYQRTGFELVKKKRNILARWLLGVKVWYFMSQDISA